MPEIETSTVSSDKEDYQPSTPIAAAVVAPAKSNIYSLASINKDNKKAEAPKNKVQKIPDNHDEFSIETNQLDAEEEKVITGPATPATLIKKLEQPEEKKPEPKKLIQKVPAINDEFKIETSTVDEDLIPE